jgi:2-amino-4-hydroxy-6-hydroxymethyldihydropteridine diphosphokinase
MITCYIGVGSNIGDRKSYIDKAIELLKSVDDVIVTRVSSIYETDPVGCVAPDKFLNGVIEVMTSISAQDLMMELRRIEKSLGRVRLEKNGPRTIDLDILYYGHDIVHDEDLTIPHPRICEREFVLRGLRELGRV